MYYQPFEQQQHLDQDHGQMDSFSASSNVPLCDMKYQLDNQQQHQDHIVGQFHISGPLGEINNEINNQQQQQAQVFCHSWASTLGEMNGEPYQQQQGAQVDADFNSFDQNWDCSFGEMNSQPYEQQQQQAREDEDIMNSFFTNWKVPIPERNSQPCQQLQQQRADVDTDLMNSFFPNWNVPPHEVNPSHHQQQHQEHIVEQFHISGPLREMNYEIHHQQQQAQVDADSNSFDQNWDCSLGEINSQPHQQQQQQQQDQEDEDLMDSFFINWKVPISERNSQPCQQQQQHLHETYGQLTSFSYNSNFPLFNTNDQQQPTQAFADSSSFSHNSNDSQRENSPQCCPVKEKMRLESVQDAALDLEPCLPSSIDVKITNVSCTFALSFYIDLGILTNNMMNVVYDERRGILTHQRRNPNCLIKVTSYGRVWISGLPGEKECIRVARIFARQAQKLMKRINEKMRLDNFSITNVMATSRMPFGIDIESIAATYPNASHEKQKGVAVLFKCPKATLNIYASGAINVFGGRSKSDVIDAICRIYPIIEQFRCVHKVRRRSNSANNKRRAPLAVRAPPLKRGHYTSSGLINNKIYFSDEEEDEELGY